VWLGGDAAARLQLELQQRLSIRSCHVVSTGRAGLALLLRALQRNDDRRRDEVVIPSYTCYSVAASVLKAGLKVRLGDVDPATLDFDYERLRQRDLRRVLAVIATNLFGLPNDLPTLVSIARERGMFVVDDAAQALGARVGNRWCGTWGDAGLYSFDKGKNLSAIDGGAVVSDSPRISDAIAKEFDALPAPAPSEALYALAKLAAYVALLPPRLYWIPNGIPALGLGETVYTTEYPMTRLPSFLAALAVTMLPRLDTYTARRRANAQRLLQGLQETPGLQLIRPVAGAEPVYVRLPVLVRDRRARDAAVASLARTGIGATGSYPRSIADIPELATHIRGEQRDATGGRTVASRIMTLPTHPYVTEQDCARAVTVLRRVLETTADGQADAAATPARVSL
jgi:dTDP-4-amino-4,6-dideoxygalactose transaminase